MGFVLIASHSLPGTLEYALGKMAKRPISAVHRRHERLVQQRLLRLIIQVKEPEKFLMFVLASSHQRMREAIEFFWYASMRVTS